MWFNKSLKHNQDIVKERITNLNQAEKLLFFLIKSLLVEKMILNIFVSEEVRLFLSMH